jgi:hypothetical protein
VTTLATPANIRAVEAANPTREVGGCTIMGRRAIAYSPNTGDEDSASSGDYWHLSDDEPLRDSEGEPMILVFERTVRVDVLTGEMV